ncbi:hypothetical protein MMC31_006613, partial [Peltigera leucophlebia]|nr:hypothetical protein [Peltigera leucophlebia]
GVINIFSDFCVLALPLASIWKLQMATKHKVGISAVFAVGLFACVSSIMRLVTSVEAIRSKDNTWDLVRTYLWTVAEITSGVVCGSLPILPQFMRAFVPKLTSIFASNSNRKGTSSQNTPSNRIYHAESRNTPKRAGSGAWHDLRDMNPKAPYVEFDRSDNRSDTVALAPREAAPAAPEETNKAEAPETPPGKGGGEAWDGPVVRQTDLESGAGGSDWQPRRSPH